ncbi:hypothetical protein Y1Q_0008476 [Alligator mississippiensis]|uniref:Uncharacterized protein n=1 Tax=Alligator mississippiensis TaxID=8496 RepID=A0A151M1F0_ALLMI|nr:hypothetical protein Y1Q_0008476 [Alligator mississippiensis]
MPLNSLETVTALTALFSPVTQLRREKENLHQQLMSCRDSKPGPPDTLWGKILDKGPTRNAATGVHLIASQAGNFSKGADTDSSAYWALRCLLDDLLHAA